MSNAFLILLLTGCGDKDEDSAGDAALQWYTSCGDPACSGWTGTDGVEVCSTEAAGEACSDASASCDLQTDCNELLVCAASDPKDQEGGCPISLAAAKEGISYLDTQQRQAVADQLLATPLATWRYRDPANGVGTKLGFIIDDVPGSPAVQASGGRVDLYGYTSMTVATVQLQQARIDALEAEVAELRRALVQLQEDRR